MKVYIKTNKEGKIIEADTNKYNELIEVEVDKELFDSLEILNCYYKNGKVEVIE